MYTHGKRMCFCVTTQTYSTIHVFTLGPSTYTLLHAWRELKVAVTMQFFVHKYLPYHLKPMAIVITVNPQGRIGFTGTASHTDLVVAVAV